MKAMQLTGLLAMEERAVPDPTIRKADDVLVRMACVGVCGSDIHYYRTGRIGDQVVDYPYTVGHEGAGTVEATGPGVTRVQPGDRVAIDPAMPCRACDQCLGGREHTCRNLRFLGCPGQAEGCLSERLVMPEHSLFPIPDAMTFEEAALSEPFAIGVYGASFLGEHPADLRIGILGAGPIGLSVLLAARAAGARTVYVTDRIDARVDFARRRGATWAGNPDRDDVVEAIRAREPLLLDAVAECCGQQEALDQAVALLKPGGLLLLVGIPETDRVSFPISDLRRKEIILRNVRRQNGCVQRALDLIADGRAPVAPMATHRFAFAQTREAFDLVANYRDGVIKAMIRI